MLNVDLPLSGLTHYGVYVLAKGEGKYPSNQRLATYVAESLNLGWSGDQEIKAVISAKTKFTWEKNMDTLAVAFFETMRA